MSELSRRAVLAFIALADLPMPKEVQFRRPWADGRIALTVEFDDSTTMLAWLELWGGSREKVRPPTPVRDGELLAWTGYADWGGYSIMLSADDPAPAVDAALDDTTRQQLQELVDERGAVAC